MQQAITSILHVVNTAAGIAATVVAFGFLVAGRHLAHTPAFRLVAALGLLALGDAVGGVACCAGLELPPDHYVELARKAAGAAAGALFLHTIACMATQLRRRRP